ncbi:MAG: hypothetical protein VB097_03785 [Rikenellaceae bacterium]|nr:hypothetical protein [Rikenellaceae bacterium]
MKKLLLIATIATITSNLTAQNAKTQSSHSIKGPLVGLSYSYEHPIAQQSTLNMELILSANYLAFAVDYQPGISIGKNAEANQM